jgi:condensin-2 complex subunit H2
MPSFGRNTGLESASTSGLLMPPPSATGSMLAAISSSQAAAAASMSQQSTILGNDDDQRFAELLRPIKDLTKNWEVPLERYLEDYIVELSELHLHLDARVNFAEAALFLQGSASVYSKKVEFLWQSVLKMLDLLASRKALDDADDGGPGGRSKRSKKGTHDINDFSLVNADVSKSNNLKTDSAAGDKVKDRKLALNFITVTPRQLIEKEGKEQKSVRVNVYTKAGASRDLIGHKEDFRVNAQYLMATANVGEELSSEQELGEQSVSLCEDEPSLFLETSLLLHPANASASPPKLDTSGDNQVIAAVVDEDDDDIVPDHHFDDFPAAANDDVDDERLSNPAASSASPSVATATTATDTDINSAESEEENRKSKRRRDKFQEILDEPKAPLADKWDPIKPHEAANVKQRPVKKGRTCKAAPNVVLKRTAAGSRGNRLKGRGEELEHSSVAAAATTAAKKVMVKAPIEQHLIHDRMYCALGKNKLVTEEFQDIAYQENKERKKSREKVSDENRSEEATGVDADTPATEDEDGWEEFQGGAFGDDGAAAADAFDDDPLPGAHANDLQVLGSMLPSSDQAGGSEDGAAAVEKDGDTYEELVVKRVAAYVQQSQEYIESTDLAKKVSSWHEHIGPRLERVEKRAIFDVHEYGSNILSNFHSDEAGDAEEDPSRMSKSRKSTVTFREVVAGKDTEEVCRYFLSSLMLANTYNIDLKPMGGSVVEGDSSPSKVQSGTMPMDNIEMILLSRRRMHEELYEEAPPPPSATATPSTATAAPSTATAATTLKGKGPRKGKASSNKQVSSPKDLVRKKRTAADMLGGEDLNGLPDL